MSRPLTESLNEPRLYPLLGKGIPILVLSLLRVVLISGLLAFLFVFWMDRLVGFV